MLANWNYVCDGHNCRNAVIEPKRIATIIHKKFKDQHPFLATLYKVKARRLETEFSKKIHVPKAFKNKSEWTACRFFNSMINVNEIFSFHSNKISTWWIPIRN